MNQQWKCMTFSELSAREVYEILKLRQEIFIMEQACLYQDIDGIDVESHHVLAQVGEILIAYARIIPHADSDIVKLGRIIVHPDHRGMALGKTLVEYTIQEAQKLFGARHIHISAQTYLKRFYESLGFRSIGSTYDLDGISHIDMALEE